MRYLKADTAQTVMVGPFVDITDGVTAETGLSLDTASEAYKYNSGSVTDISGLTFTHVAQGMYSLALTAAVLDTEGYFTVHIPIPATALHWWEHFMVLNANVYDSLFAAATTDYLQTDTTQHLGTAAATPTVAGVPEVDVTHWLGTAAATPTVAGVPEVDLTHISGTVHGSTQIRANTIQMSGDATAADVLELFAEALDQSTGQLDAGTFAAIAELAQAAPSATPGLYEAVMALYMALRNKVDVTSSVKEFHNDAGTVVFKKTLSDDGTTYSEAEAASGA